LFYQTLTAFILALSNPTEEITVPPSVEKRLSNEKSRKALTNKIYDGVKKAQLVSFLNGSFTLDQLATNGIRVDKSDYNSGIYAIAYRNFGGKFEGDDPKLYIGKLINVSERMRIHNSDFKNPKKWSYHYEARREAKQKAEILICALDPKDQELMAIAEQVSPLCSTRFIIQ